MSSSARSRAPSCRSWSPSLRSFLTPGTPRLLREPGRHYVVLRLETLENILAPNLFSLVAGVVPNLAVLGSAGLTALEDYASNTLPPDYGSALAADEMSGAEAPSLADAVPATPPPSEADLPALEPVAWEPVQSPASIRDGGVSATPVDDNLFIEPLNAADLVYRLPNPFFGDVGSNIVEAPTAGWSALGGATGESSTPSFTASNQAAGTIPASAPPPAPAAVNADALDHLAAPSANPAPPVASPTPASPVDKSAVLQAVADQGLRFETNRGQFDTRYDFVAHGPTLDVAVNATDAAVAVNPTQADAATVAVNMHLVGGNATAAAEGGQALAGVTNYFGDAASTYTGIVGYGRAAFHDVYAGVDVVYHGSAATRQLEYDFVVAPNADAGQVVLDFQGTDRVALDARGGLVLHTAGGDLGQQAPVAYQEIDGARRAVASQFTIDSDNHVHFALGGYDHARALTIDPAYVYSSFLGGTNGDAAYAVAVNASKVYVVGSSGSPFFRPRDPNPAAVVNPTLLPGNGNFAGAAYAIAIDPTNNNQPIYFDYFGGNHAQVATAVAVDGNNNAYITGYTTSNVGFPVTTAGSGSNTSPAWQAAKGGAANSNAFVIFLNATGGETYGSYLGGTGSDCGYGIALDGNGSVYVAGSTSSAAFNANKAPDAVVGPAVAGQSVDGFVAQLTTAQGQVTSLVYIGGTGSDTLKSIAAGPNGNVNVAGTTASANLVQGVNATNPSFQTAASPGGDALVADLVYAANQAAPAVSYDTYFGGDGTDQAAGVAVDPTTGDAYVVGLTTSSAGAGWGAGGANPAIVQPTVLGATGGQDAWVAKFDNKGSPSGAKSYFVYIAGTSTDSAAGVALAPIPNATPNLYVAGTTSSADDIIGKFPATPAPGKLQPFNQGSLLNAQDAFLACLDPNAANGAASLVALSYIGGTNTDSGAGVASQPAGMDLGNAWVVGATGSRDFRFGNLPALQQTYGGGGDGFVVSISPPTPAPGQA